MKKTPINVITLEKKKEEKINVLEWAPPATIIAAVTLFASTLDLLADFLLCARLYEFLPNFVTQIARNCAYGYFIFTGISVIVYVFEMIDVCLTLKHEQEDVFYARLAKSLVLTLEEVPLPGFFENVRRCFTFTKYRIAMVIVNIFHMLAIFIVVNNLIESGKGGRPIAVQSSGGEA
uniref:Ion transport domain-containing protein n=1 Tax=Panagrolaimus sp. PS1159 TaxID=55785 RepID=A0AC35FFQ8_9BILA